MSETFYRGCLFCKTGKEENVVRGFNLLVPQGRAISPVKMRCRRQNGIALEEWATLLPGYVFFETAVDPPLRELARLGDVLRLLTYADGDWRLHGADDRFAGMLFAQDGKIALSKAAFDEGDRIRIVDGFMKEYEGDIIRVNRRAKTAEVRLTFQDKIISMWLGYELIARTGADASDEPRR